MALLSLFRRQAEPEVPSAVPEIPSGSTSPDPEKDSFSSKEEQSDVKYVDRAELTELTPMEALHWNVDGDQSPFPEVAACVSTEDDPTLEVNSQASLFPSCSGLTAVSQRSGCGF